MSCRNVRLLGGSQMTGMLELLCESRYDVDAIPGVECRRMGARWIGSGLTHGILPRSRRSRALDHGEGTDEIGGCRQCRVPARPVRVDDRRRAGTARESAARLARSANRCLLGDGEARFTDRGPTQISLGGLASLSDLTAKAGVDVDMRRFRLNFSVDGIDEWGEMDWVGKRLRIGESRGD